MNLALSLDQRWQASLLCLFQQECLEQLYQTEGPKLVVTHPGVAEVFKRVGQYLNITAHVGGPFSM